MGVTGGPFRIDNDIAPGNVLDVTDGMNSGFRCASENHLILHTFYWGDDGLLDAVLYKKSLDGGQTFLDPETVSLTAYGLPAIWADWWNGGTGTNIHITYVSGGTKGVYYNRLDTATGQFAYAAGSEPLCYDGNGIRPNALPGQVITKMSNGLLVIAFNDGADGGVWLVSKDNGASWYVAADQPLLSEDLGGLGEGAWAIAEVGNDDRLWMVVRNQADTAFYEWLVDFDDDKNQGLRTGDDTTSLDINGTNHYGQTFQVATAHYLKMVKFKCYRVGSPGNVVMSLYATSGGLPTGAALATVTVNGNNFTTDTAGEWEYFFLVPKYATQLTAATTYAIVLDCDTAGTATDYVKILVDSGNGYANGQAISGPTWAAVTGSDCMFVEAEFYVNSKEKATITPAPTGDTLLLGSTALCMLQNPSDGYTYLVYNTGGSNGTGSIYCKRMDPATNTFADRTTILTTDGVADTSVDVSMAIDEGTGDIFVIYNYNNTTVTVIDWDVYMKKSTDGGNIWGTATKLPTGAIDDHRWPRTNAYLETGLAGIGANLYVEYGNDDLNDLYGLWADFTYPYPDLETDFTPILTFDTQAEWTTWSDGPVNDESPLVVSDGLWFSDWKNGTTSPYLAGSQQAAGYTLRGAPVDISGKAMSLTIKTEAPAFMQSLANRGMFIRLWDNQTPTAGWAEWDILGSDTAQAGWQTLLVSGDRTPDAQSSSPTFDKTKCNMFGIRVTTAVKDNKDVQRFVISDLSLGSQLVIKGGASDDKLTFEKIRGWSDFFGYGLFSRLGDLFISVAKIIFGDSTGVVDTYFEDTNKVIQFSPGGFGNNYYSVEFKGHANVTTDVKLGDFVTAGEDKSGFAGCIISTAPNRLGQQDRVSIDMSDSNGVPKLAGCKFVDIENMTFYWHSESLIDCSIEGMQPIEVNEAYINAGKFVGAYTAALKLDEYDEAAVIKNISLVDNPIAVRMTAGGPYSMDNWKFFNNVIDIDFPVDATEVFSLSETNQDGDFNLNNTNKKIAVIAYGGISEVLSHAAFYLKKVGSPTGNCYAKLYEETVSGPGSLILTSEPIAVSSLGTSYAMQIFEFHSAYFLNSGSGIFYLSLEYDDGDASNYIVAGIENPPLSSGDLFNTHIYTTSWSAEQTFEMVYNWYSNGLLVVNATNGANPSAAKVQAVGTPTPIVIINNPKSFKFTLNPSITGYEWRIYEVTALGSLAGAVEIAGQESATQDNQTYNYNYSSDQPIAVQIIPQPDEDYEESVTYYTLRNADQDISITLTEDINN